MSHSDEEMQEMDEECFEEEPQAHPQEHFKPNNMCFCLGIFLVCCILLACVLFLGGIKTFSDFVDPFEEARAKVVTAEHGAVSSSSLECSKIGVKVLEEGGTAVDASIATSMCLGVVHPHETGLGGGGYMLVFTPNPTPMGGDASRVEALDFRESSGAKIPMIQSLEDEEEAEEGKGEQKEEYLVLEAGSSIAIPGFVSGMAKAHKQWGNVTWARLLEESVTLAKEWEADSDIVEAWEELEEEAKESGVEGDRAEKKLALVKAALGVNSLAEGNMLKSEALSATLKALSESANPAEDFYAGKGLGSQVVGDLEAAEGCTLTRDDLVGYAPEQDTPITTWLNGHKMYTANSAGGSLLALVMNIMEGEDLSEGKMEAAQLHRLLEALRFASIARTLLGDDPLVTRQVEKMVETLNSKDTAAQLRDLIYFSVLEDREYLEIFEMLKEQMAKNGWEKAKDTDPGLNTKLGEHFGAEHVSVVTKTMTVSVTTGLGRRWGSGVAGKQTGILMNDQLNSFVLATKSESGLPNRIGPNQRPSADYCPTIVTKDTQVHAAVGASGGFDVVSSVAQFLIQATGIGFNKEMGEALLMPRVHNSQWWNEGGSGEDRIFVKGKLDEVTESSIEHRGHKIEETEEIGDIQAIIYHPDEDVPIIAGSEANHGSPAGY